MRALALAYRRQGDIELLLRSVSMERDDTSSALSLTPAPAPAPVAVVSPQFCAPHLMPLTVTKEVSFSGGDFTVTDDDANNGAVVLQVKGTFLCVRYHRELHDAAGQAIILTMQRKVFSLLDTWEVFRGDSTAANDLLFTVKKISIFPWKTQMDVFLAGNTTAEQVDFRIMGSSYFDLERSCAFYRGNSDVTIAQMNRQYTLSNVLLGTDTYSVSVFPHVDYAFIVALVVILDEMHRGRTIRTTRRRR